MLVYIFHVLLLLGILDQGQGCNLWCRKPMSFEYFCCEKGNPFLESADGHFQATSESSQSETTTPATTSTTAATTEQSCRYFCVYNAEKVYCCDDGSQPLPEDHFEHDGRCATKKEQVCKKKGIYIYQHSSKLTTKSGGNVLSSIVKGGQHSSCASDGYCAENEKCCQNKCAKKHTCLQSVYDYDGTKKKIQKKQRKQ